MAQLNFLPSRGNGRLKLFRLWGIDVFVDWVTWAIFGFVFWNTGLIPRSPLGISAFIIQFGIVLMHEFGHALACRQTGGKADQISLWPLGGVAFVQPPPRASAHLWSIAAGPLVNVVLAPILYGLMQLAHHVDLTQDEILLIHKVFQINLALLIFNLLPIYPLDGGQILRSLLWFVVGPIRSLIAASVTGFVLFGALIIVGFYTNYLRFDESLIWPLVLGSFILGNCYRGLQTGLAAAKLEKTQRHTEFACPACGAAPYRGEFWTCNQCGGKFDMFASNAFCPGCGAHFIPACPQCRTENPIAAWRRTDAGGRAR